MPFAKINNQEIYFEDTKENKQAIVFMHGFLMDHSLFDPQTDVLKSQYRCIRWDARGFGQTKWDGQAFNLYDSVSDCFGLMDYLGIESAILVGMSQGGYCALRAALTNPNRVNGLVLISTRSAVDEEPLKQGYREMRDTWVQYGAIQPLLEGLATAILGAKEISGMEKYWDMWLPKWKVIAGQTIFHAMNNLLDRDEIDHRLPEIQCPALVVHGSEDHAIPLALGEALSKNLVNCKNLIVAPGAHAINFTHSEIVNPPLIQFIENLSLQM